MANVLIASLNGASNRDAVDFRLGFAEVEDLKHFVDFFRSYQTVGGYFMDPGIYWLFGLWPVVLTAEQNYVKALNDLAIENMRNFIVENLFPGGQPIQVFHQKTEAGIKFQVINLPSITQVRQTFSPAMFALA